jgi:integrase
LGLNFADLTKQVLSCLQYGRTGTSAQSPPGGGNAQSVPEALGMRTATLAQSAFRDAAQAWLESRQPYICPRTAKSYEERIRVMAETLKKLASEMHMGIEELTLPDITPDIIRAYQRERMKKAGASCINHECSLLQQMLKRIGCWTEIASGYQPLPLPRESPHRALTVQEEERLYRVGMSNPAWDVAYCAYVLSINTTSGPGELRHLRLMDIDDVGRTMRIQPEGAKTPGRIRVIPLNHTAWEAIEYLRKRAKGLGCSKPEHYLIPFRLKRNSYDPTRPAKGWRTAFREMCVAADIKISPYCLRHHAITKLLENPDVSEETAEAIAGHISHKVKKRYSHIRIEFKRSAVMALEKISPKSVRAQNPKYVKTRAR